jgi:hypothetical protein
MSGRVTVMEDGRARHAECVEHGIDVLLVYFYSPVTLNKKWHDAMISPVTKGLCAPVICLLKN